MKSFLRFFQRLILGVAFTIAATCTQAADETPAVTVETFSPFPRSTKIRIASGPKFLEFGTAAKYRVEYRNTSESPWQLKEEPNKSANVQCVMVNVADGSPRGGRSFDQDRVRFHQVVQPDGKVMEIVLLEPGPNQPKPLTVLPKQTYGFDVPFNERPFEIWEPGNHFIYVEDWNAELCSAEYDVSVVLTNSSVASLLKVAVDPKFHRAERDDACQYLHRLKTDLNCQFGFEDDTEAMRAEHEADSQKQLKSFAAWWDKNKDTAAVQKSIDEINREFGLDPAEVRRQLAEQAKPKAVDLKKPPR